jgi:hypothetical protein
MLMDGRSSLGGWQCLIAAMTLIGCAAQGGEQDAASTGAALEAAPALMVTPFEDPEGIAATGDGQVTRTISSARQYERVFGHPLPDGISLRGGRVAIFYSAGVQPTGGYEASFERVEVRGRTLVVTTRLTSPGPNCRVTESLTHPYALATLHRPRNVTRVRFQSDDTVRDCEEPPITCGGFAGTPCPENLKCVDDPSDDCDPNNGGADCGGVCLCLDNVLCIKGSRFDSSPDVCACVPDPTQDPCAAVRCAAGTHCEADGDAASCVADGRFCGGIAGIECPGGGKCVDDPSDDCDPNNGGADCGGVCSCIENVLCIKGSRFDSSPDVCACVPDPTQDPCAAVRCAAGTHCEADGDAASCVADGRFCGGIADIECPGGGKCVDDPNDDCDPNNGGADCGGRCSCIETVLCVKGSMFDSSPDVCACVPDPTQDRCAAVRCVAGTHCEADAGSATCVADGPFCGGIAGIACPGAGTCGDNPGDGCDPNNGGADCGGICSCNALGLCESGFVWNSSPEVCGCVLENPCIATLCPVNTTCEVIDGNATCLSDGSQECGSAKCGKGTTCCNASCGICTPPGFACIQIACLQP